MQIQLPSLERPPRALESRSEMQGAASVCRARVCPAFVGVRVRPCASGTGVGAVLL